MELTQDAKYAKVEKAMEGSNKSHFMELGIFLLQKGNPKQKEWCENAKNDYIHFRCNAKCENVYL